MKKLLILAAMVAMVCVLLCGCSTFECDICGEKKSGRKYTSGEYGQEVIYCKDCHDDMEEYNGLFG